MQMRNASIACPASSPTFRILGGMSLKRIIENPLLLSAPPAVSVCVEHAGEIKKKKKFPGPPTLNCQGGSCPEGIH